MTTIPDTRLDEIVRRLVDEFHPERIILFGSRAWGRPTEDSDLDVLVIVERTDETPARRSTRAYRCTRGVGVPMDLLVWTREETDRQARTWTTLASEVLERGIVLYDGRSEAG